MSYTITWIHGDYVETELQRLDDEKKLIINPQVELAKNSAGSFKFTMTSGHHYYGQLSLFTDYIDVSYQGFRIFYGRIIKYTKNFDKSVTYECEGQMAFFYDSYIYSTETYAWANDALELLLGIHNRMLGYDNAWLPINLNSMSMSDVIKHNRMFSLVTGDPFNTTVKLKDLDLTEGCTSYDALVSLLSEVGGYVEFGRGENTFNSSTHYNTIRYYSSHWDKASQEVRFGANLLDYVEEFNRDDIVTCVHGIAKVTSGETETELLTASQYYGDADLISLYGCVVKTLDCGDEITTLSALRTRCEQYLANQYDNLTINVTVADLSLAEEYDEIPFRLNQLVHVISEPHNVDAWMPLTAMSIELDDPSATQLTLGETKRKGLVEQLVNPHVKPTPTQQQSESSEGTSDYPKYKTTANVNMRSSASSKSTKLTTVPKGKTVTVTKTSGQWLYTTYSGKTGWICGKYAKKI